jgi:hypothetical protein
MEVCDVFVLIVVAGCTVPVACDAGECIRRTQRLGFHAARCACQ